ncbi:hypothetical protein LAZ67_11003443 [Cordylochernes scorpioides]|uniref:Uncharacterized protein n=1 Tax=Cordylochernes scorpioides TaxID=51811 RepID=A0ABY6L0C3_9ARAC|nr:hypothetical protein LAZ67_8002658 [Cordylochernes scorpioides]UYV74408.1 hypothetical protein LAZ67_11003443 [Cordylochernes scorpioides]
MIMVYNMTKGGVDVLDEMTATYNCARNSRIWPMVIFYSLLNIGAIYSQIIHFANGNTSKVKSRRHFLKTLSLDLIEEMVKFRTACKLPEFQADLDPKELPGWQLHCKNHHCYPQRGGADDINTQARVPLQEYGGTSSIKEKFWNFKKANWNLYQQNTNEDFRKAPTRIKYLEQNWIFFKNTIIKAAKVSIPRGNIKKWIPNYTDQAKDFQTLITKRNELQKKCTQNQTNCRTELNIVNAKIKRLYVNMKREKWKQTCENLNPRNPNTKLWHLAKQIDRAQPQTENTNMIENIDGTPATNDKNAANLLGNSYQISSKIKFEIKDKKVEKKARKVIHDCKNFTSTHNIFHEKINMKELDYALENTDLNNTPGPDGIHGQIISNLGKNGK